MKYIITGGAGFIGSHIAEELVKRGEEAAIIDDLSSGKLENINEFKDKVRFVKGNIGDIDLLKKEFKSMDFVIHLAALTSVMQSMNFPKKYNEINIDGTLNVLKAAKECNVKRVVFASSSAVYGNSDIIPQKESLLPNPLSPYGNSKLEGENLCAQYLKKGLETVSLRYFNVFGPRQNPDSQYAAVIPKFIASILNSKQPAIYGDGNQSRDFIFVKDVANANINACKEDVSGEVINIGSGEKISIHQLLEKINKSAGKDIQAKYHNPREGDAKHTLADISKQARLLKLQPAYSLDDGLKETVEWFRKNF
ncbi:MAG: SDR family oxidoreductase [Nanoarchaeota archaeon]|nr:SDR family oxidoreductase [Nanoarchaeota archaeon]MBU1005778.1 SDR family oxidoreductase [Nanoarchaeota archaeon]MBU1946649.1 SDR family oxidoreductase [Nanoarchaeota archaeon]